MEKIMRDLSKNFNEIKKFSLKSQKKFYLEKILESYTLEEIVEAINFYLQLIKNKADISNFENMDKECEDLIVFFQYNEDAKSEDDLLDEVWLIVNDLCYKALGKNDRMLVLPITLRDLELKIDYDIPKENIVKVIKYILLELSILANLI